MSRALIVVAAYDDAYTTNLASLHGAPVAVIDTSGGGHPSGAIVRAYERYRADEYLFVQDSMAGIAEDVLEPFRGRGPVVAWCRFGFNFDTPGQAAWVRGQYPGQPDPAFGIFGPVFYATRKALQRAEPFFPAAPRDKLEAQGTERAWAFCFQAAGLPVTGLHERDPRGAEDGSLPPFRKHFANRA